ncbi:MAG: hypothetical protein CL680_17025 [Blastomonas sp.]|nr:hypothetical protein [Blastomonas sp.]|tara:strand:- start:3478 stop:5427 length:1950 start_codon:yes stop_codon:yes gene_type:complete
MTDVTIITPVFNTQDYLHKNIRSVLDQKNVNLKLILVDDGSTDNSLGIARYYSSIDPRVSVISQSNQGQGPARNAALEQADSEFVYFVDSDDSLGPDTLALLTKTARELQLDVCSPNVPMKYFDKRLELTPCLPCKSQFLRKSIIDAYNIRQPNSRSGQDGVFSHLYLSMASRIGINKDAIFNYTSERPGSTFAKYKKMHSVVPTLIKSHMLAIREFYDKYDLWERSSDRFLMFLANETIENRIAPHLSRMTDEEVGICISEISPLFEIAKGNLRVFNRRKDKFFQSVKKFLDLGSLDNYISPDCSELANNNFKVGNTSIVKYWNNSLAPKSISTTSKEKSREEYIKVSKKQMKDIENKLDFLINIVNNNSYMITATLKNNLPILAKNDNDIIVSLTTLPSRINSLDLTLTSLLKQSHLPSKIVVWITKKIDRSYISDDVLAFENHGVEFRFVDDVGPHTKLIYALKEFGDNRIVTVDDDIIYPPNMIKCLMSASAFSPQSICANWARELAFDTEGKVKGIRDGKLLTPPLLEKEIEQSSSFDHVENKLAFPYGTSGVLYPPGCFDSVVFNFELFKKLCPKEDDIWFKVCSMIKGTSVVVTNLGINPKHHCIHGSQEEALRHFNHAQDGNKAQMQSVFEYFDIKSEDYI